MFNVNDIVVYGLNGVCTIVNVKQLQFGISKDQENMYYHLHPISSNDEHIIYVPVDKVSNDSGIMRGLLSRGELERVIDNISNIEPLSLKNEKNRREDYRSALLTLIPENCIALIKSVRNRRHAGTLQRKNISETDLEFEKLATKIVCLEISVVLGISYEEAEYRVFDKIDFT